MSKNIVITGSTSGIGYLTAIKLATAGHTIYLHGRNQQKLDTAIMEIKERSGSDAVAGFVANFSDLNEVVHMAKQINDHIPTLDVLINNAGVLKTRANKNNSGYDLRFVVNYFAPYLLTRELIPLLKKTHRSRVINLSSAAQAPVSIEALRGKQEVSQWDAYSQSKLALTM